MPGTLFVEDDAVIGRLVTAELAEHGHEVTWCVDGASALAAAARDDVDVCLVDLGLPDGDGLELVRSLRRSHPGSLIIVTTARGEPIDVVAGLDAGADDYVVKPFTMIELLARLRAHGRRRPTLTAEPPADVVECGALSVDLGSRRVTVGGVVAPLREREYQVLEMLVRVSGRAVSRQVVLRDLWPSSEKSAGKALDVTVTTLRRKLEDAASTSGVPSPVITTLRGFGYRLEPDGGPAAGPPAPRTGS